MIEKLVRNSSRSVHDLGSVHHATDYHPLAMENWERCRDSKDYPVFVSTAQSIDRPSAGSSDGPCYGGHRVISTLATASQSASLSVTQ